MPSALTPIAWQSLSSATATVTFSSIPGTYRDLRLVVTGTSSVTGNNVVATFNGDSATNYSNVIMWGDGGSASSTTSSPRSNLYQNFAAYFDTTTPTVFTADILDYSATDKHKTMHTRAGRAGAASEALAGRWASTAAITTIAVTQLGGNFNAGSTFALYGVSA